MSFSSESDFFGSLNFQSISLEFSVVFFLPPTGAFFVDSVSLVVLFCPLGPKIFIANLSIILSEEIQTRK